jgi:hypothetical protein
MAALPVSGAAIGHAVANAPDGVRLQHLPLHPDRVVAALEAAREAAT